MSEGAANNDTPRTISTCAFCHKGFTPDEWDNRHTVHFGTTEAHAHCCERYGPCSNHN